MRPLQFQFRSLLFAGALTALFLGLNTWTYADTPAMFRVRPGPNGHAVDWAARG